MSEQKAQVRSLFDPDDEDHVKIEPADSEGTQEADLRTHKAEIEELKKSLAKCNITHNATK